MPEEQKQQKLSKMMQERLENSARIQAKLEAEGYQRKDATVSYLTANLMLSATGLPLCILFCLLYALRWSEGVIDVFAQFFGSNRWLVLLLVILSVPVHEFLHGLGFFGFCEKKWKSVQFGFHLSSLTPYCHCREAIGIGAYYLALLLPCTVLGIIPAVIAAATGMPLLFCFGLYNIILASGDLTIALVLLRYLGKNCRILDHPNQCGSIVFLK